jgi:hypothetical protein
MEHLMSLMEKQVPPDGNKGGNKIGPAVSTTVLSRHL